jgi:hypothetical protein
VGFLIAILVLVLIGLVAVVVGAPLRRARRVRDSASGTTHPSLPADAPAAPPAHTREELEAAREAKYREIRDAELDYRTGKLSRADYEAINADLRAEAIEILNRLDPPDRLAGGDSRESADAPEA